MSKIPGFEEVNWPEQIKKLLVKGSVLDLCCGGGKFYPVFDGREYTGVDKDQEAIKMAKINFPDGKWIISDVAQYNPMKKFSNIFTWVALQHVPPRDIEKVFKMMKESSDNIIMCERIYDPEPLGDEDAPSRYLWTHDYQKHFPGLNDLGSISGEVHLMNWRNNG